MPQKKADLRKDGGVVEKDMLVTDLRITDTQDRPIWRLGSKNPLNSCSPGKAGFQEVEHICQHSWNKWMMMVWVKLNQK